MNLPESENLLVNFFTQHKIAVTIAQDFITHTIRIYFDNGTVRTIQVE